MIDTIGVCAFVIKNDHDVKPSLQFGKIWIPINIYQCRFGNVKSFAIIHRLQSCIYRVKSTRLHFHEDEMCVSSHDEINFPIFDAEIFTQELITLGSQVFSSELFSHARELRECHFVHGAKKSLT